MAVPRPVEDVKILSSISTFVLNTLTPEQSAFFFTNYALYLINKCAELPILKFFKLNMVETSPITCWTQNTIQSTGNVTVCPIGTN